MQQNFDIHRTLITGTAQFSQGQRNIYYRGEIPLDVIASNKLHLLCNPS